MRHLLLAILIALLPLRAWVGDAMAITMLAPSSSHESMVMAPVEGAPCADHAMGAATDTADHQHQTCDVCNGPAMALALQFDLLASATHGVLATPTERFDSSVPPPGNKPPIS
ncbi:hypothetical protein [Hydrogenophaga sp. IBVHS1]|jgi:hypothetical protein|uniref:hypothetical protein n=1 Tax=unclassified Hydrogenophaga TaxID=2610897 RepID=UPI000A2D226F|nr:hypothetical protein [Hydrogenophaga sp. IBVHS1]OSZ76199.1 hypothetical protein CAP37_12880 [Hydrogenophaga sp. IBVHS1]